MESQKRSAKLDILEIALITSFVLFFLGFVIFIAIDMFVPDKPKFEVGDCIVQVVEDPEEWEEEYDVGNAKEILEIGKKKYRIKYLDGGYELAWPFRWIDEDHEKWDCREFKQ